MCLVIEMIRATNVCLELGLTWRGIVLTKIAKFLDSNVICEVFLMILSVIQKNKNDKHSEAKFDCYHERYTCCQDPTENHTTNATLLRKLKEI